MQIYLAPMEGLTTFVYRNALQKYYGGVDKFFTPFLSSKTLNHKEQNEVLPEHNKGISLVPQILTNQTETFTEICRQLSEYGYREVNLNLGCPSGTVVAKKRGAGLLEDPYALDKLLRELFETCSLEISVKTRIGIDSPFEWEDLLKVYAKYPIKELIIHPRLQKQFYNGKPSTDAFLQAKDFYRAHCTFDTVLIYNGDIVSCEGLSNLQDCLGPQEQVMVGRGLLSRPSLASELKTNTSKPFDAKHFFAFHDEILEGYIEIMSGGTPVLFRMKELWSYLHSYLPLSEKQLKTIQKSKKLEDYKSCLLQIRQALL